MKKATLFICFTFLLIPIWSFSESQTIWRGLEMGMSRQQVQDVLNVTLIKQKASYGFDFYQVYTIENYIIYNTEQPVLVFLKFHDDKLYLVRFMHWTINFYEWSWQNNFYDDEYNPSDSEIYFSKHLLSEFISRKNHFIKLYGNSTRAENITPPDYAKEEWLKNCYHLMKNNGALTSVWDNVKPNVNLYLGMSASVTAKSDIILWWEYRDVAVEGRVNFLINQELEKIFQ